MDGNRITGLHHLTAMTSDAQRNIDFYAGILGLRLVKKTINFDAPDVYHLYYGNRTGEPGTILTFFPFQGLPKGRKGNGQVTVTAFSVPGNSLDFWMKRLSAFSIPFKEPAERLGESYIYFEDFDGLGLEIVENENDSREGFTYGNIPPEYAIKGLHGITISYTDSEKTAALLTGMMNYILIDSKDNLFRYAVGDSNHGYVDIISNPALRYGLFGSGTVHHVAFATPDDNMQLELREKLIEEGKIGPTPVTDRQYFHSVYFREPGGVLFEAATCDIGFTIDEPVERLGESLRLPPWEEKNREEIEDLLPEVFLDIEKFSGYAQVRHS